MSKLDFLGLGRIYGDRKTRDLVVDTDSIRRGEFAGDEEFSGNDDDDWGDDDFGEEVEGDEVEGDDDIGDEVEGDEDFGDEVEGSDFAGPPRRRRPRRGQRPQRPNKPSVPWGATIVTGDDSFTAGAPGDSDSFTIPIRLQHKFKAQDITFELTNLSKANVQSVMFGDRPVWTANGSGVSTSLFGTTSMLRSLLKGQKIREGLDITINGTMTATAAGAASITAALTGLKPTPVC